MSDFSTPNKECIRRYYNKPIIRRLKQVYNCDIIYYGLPSPDAEDIAEWIEYISSVVAFQCRDYGNVSDPAENGAYPPTLNGLIHPVLPLNWP